MANLATLFLKEPGKSTTINLKNLASSKLDKLLLPGIELKPKIKSKNYQLLLNKEQISKIEEESIKRKIKYAQDKNIDIKFFLVKKTKQDLEILIRTSRPIFLSNNPPDVKPFTKHEEIIKDELMAEEDGEENDSDETETTPPKQLRSSEFETELDETSG